MSAYQISPSFIPSPLISCLRVTEFSLLNNPDSVLQFPIPLLSLVYLYSYKLFYFYRLLGNPLIPLWFLNPFGFDTNYLVLLTKKILISSFMKYWFFIFFIVFNNSLYSLYSGYNLANNLLFFYICFLISVNSFLYSSIVFILFSQLTFKYIDVTHFIKVLFYIIKYYV